MVIEIMGQNVLNRYIQSTKRQCVVRNDCKERGGKGGVISLGFSDNY